MNGFRCWSETGATKHFATVNVYRAVAWPKTGVSKVLELRRVRDPVAQRQGPESAATRRTEGRPSLSRSGEVSIGPVRKFHRRRWHGSLRLGVQSRHGRRRGEAEGRTLYP